MKITAKPIFVLIFLGCFLLQVFESVQKYFDGFLTKAVYSIEASKAILPSVSICSGFNRSMLPSNYEIGNIENGANIFDFYPWPESESFVTQATGGQR